MFAQLFSKRKPAQKPTTQPVNQIFRHFLFFVISCCLISLMYEKTLNKKEAAAAAEEGVLVKIWLIRSNGSGRCVLKKDKKLWPL